MNAKTKDQEAPTGFLTSLRRGMLGQTTARSNKSGRRKRFGIGRIIALAMIVIVPLIGAAGLFGSSAANAAEDKLDNYAFYDIGSSLMAFYSTVQEPGAGGGFDPTWDGVLSNPGSAGSFLGYADAEISDFTGWLTSGLSGSSDAIGYATLKTVDQDGNALGTNDQGLADYAYFGAALNGLGLDGTSTGLSVGFLNTLAGGLVMILYVLSGGVDLAFNWVIDTLAFLNPFKLFFTGVEAINAEFASGMVGGTAVPGVFVSLSNWIGEWYGIITTLSWAVMVPLFIATLLLGVFLFKKMDKLGGLKKLIIRVVFIGLGLPLLGSMYTGVVEQMSSSSTEGNAASTRAVMSTFVDFENWVGASRLALPSGTTVEWKVKDGTPSGASQAQVRSTTLAINNATHQLNLTPIVSSTTNGSSFAEQIMNGRTTDAATSADVYETTVDMLGRYASGAQVSAASFETSSKGDLRGSSAYKNDTEKVAGWFKDLTQDANSLNSDSVNPSANAVISVIGGRGLQATGSVNERKFTTNTDCVQSGYRIVYQELVPRSCNLSPMAMYNYLNTDFGPSSMVMYSSKKASSEATRSIHNSVNLVGTGTMSGLYYTNTVVLLGAFVLIGFFYAVGTLIASIRRGIQTIAAVPFATLGALAAIAKVIIYTIALIVEIILTIFLYKIVQEFLSSLPAIIESPFALVLNSNTDLAGYTEFLVNGPSFSLVVTVLSIIMTVAFTVMALRVRKGLLKAVEETVTKLVEKFMDTQVGMPSSSGAGAALGGGLAAGAGSAMANRMMSSGTKGAVASGPSTGGGGNGPGAISTGGGVISTGPGPDSGGGAGAAAITDGGSPPPPGGDVAVTVGPDTPPNGGGGGSLPAGDTKQLTAAQEVELGRDVANKGLSQNNARSPQVGGDAMSSGSDALEKSAEGYRAADKKRLEAGTAGAKAVGNAGVAVGRGVAGDAAGAAASGGKALEQGGAAAAAGHQAAQASKDAGRSSLDAPDRSSAKRAQQARAVGQVGSTVSGVAGVAGGSKAPSADAAAKQVGPSAGTPKAPAPSQARPNRVQSPQPPRAPAQAHSAPRQQAAQPGPRQPAPAAPQAPRPQGAQQAPAPAPRSPKAPTSPRQPAPVKAPQPRTPRPERQPKAVKPKE